MITGASRRLRVKITKVNEATGNVNTFQFLLKLGPFRRTLLTFPQKHSGIMQLKSIVTQSVPLNTFRPSYLTQVQPVSRNASLLALASQSTKVYLTSRTRCFIALSSCGVVRPSCKKRACGHSLMRSSKISLLCHRPNVPGHQKKGRIRIVHLSTAQTFLEASKMQECHDAFC